MLTVSLRTWSLTSSDKNGCASGSALSQIEINASVSSLWYSRIIILFPVLPLDRVDHLLERFVGCFAFGQRRRVKAFLRCQLVPSRKSVRINLFALQCTLDGATRFAVMSAIAETTLACQGNDVSKHICNSGLDIGELKLSHAGRVQHRAAIGCKVQLPARRRVATLAVIFANGSRIGQTIPKESIDQCRFPDTRRPQKCNCLARLAPWSQLGNWFFTQ